MRNIRLKKAILIAAACIAVFVSIAVGSVMVPLGDVAAILWHRLLQIPLPEHINPNYQSLVADIRLPRVLLAFLVGGAMAINGAVIQSVLKNPLASPYGIGVSAGAGLGAALVIVGGISTGIFGIFLLPVFGLLFGLAAVLLVMGVSSRIDNSLSNMTVVLTGMVVSLFLNAIMSFMATLSPQSAQRISLWQLGSFSSKPWSYVGVFVVVLIVCFCVFQNFAEEMDVMTFGEEQAAALGVNLKRTKWILLCTMAILTGTAVSFVGIIGFVDLIAPHIVRKLFGSKHKSTLFANFLFGGIFMVLCDLASRTLTSPREIPIGSITALLGAPFFVYLFCRQKEGIQC